MLTLRSTVALALLFPLAVIAFGVATKDRREREQSARRQLIVSTARTLAEAEAGMR